MSCTRRSLWRNPSSQIFLPCLSHQLGAVTGRGTSTAHITVLFPEPFETSCLHDAPSPHELVCISYKEGHLPHNHHMAQKVCKLALMSNCQAIFRPHAVALIVPIMFFSTNGPRCLDHVSHAVVISLVSFNVAQFLTLPPRRLPAGYWVECPSVWVCLMFLKVGLRLCVSWQKRDRAMEGTSHRPQSGGTHFDLFHG